MRRDLATIAATSTRLRLTQWGENKGLYWRAEPEATR